MNPRLRPRPHPRPPRWLCLCPLLLPRLCKGQGPRNACTEFGWGPISTLSGFPGYDPYPAALPLRYVILRNVRRRRRTHLVLIWCGSGAPPTYQPPNVGMSTELAADISTVVAVDNHISRGHSRGHVPGRPRPNPWTSTAVSAASRGRSANGTQSDAGDHHTNDWSIAFKDNYAGGYGGAMNIIMADQLHISDVLFQSNEGTRGGAAFIAALDNTQALFSACVFEENKAEDGGALYLYTAPGLDIINESIFRNNFADTSGGAIFHTGLLHLFNSDFEANMVGVEGPAIMSVGFLEEMSNLYFSENTYRCRAGEYGYIAENETEFCSPCFDEVCSRCSAGRDGGSDSSVVRIDGEPVCDTPPQGAIAPSSGTTIITLTLEKGYYRTSNQSHDVLTCYHEHACQGGSDADEYCTPGYMGPYCAVCTEGFASGIAYSCHKCSEGITRSAVGLIVAFTMVVIMLVALLMSHLGSVVHHGADENTELGQSSLIQRCWSSQASLLKVLPLTAIKIIVTVWQIISQFDAIAGDVYPDLYANFISKLNPINLDLGFVFSYSCLVSNDFYDHLVFATIAPLVVLVFLAGSFIVRTKRNSGSESAMREVKHKHQAAVLYMALFVYSPVSNIIFQTFGCDALDDGDIYLRADYSLSCLTSQHSWYEIYALIMMVVYPVGIAAAFTGLLFLHRCDLVKSDRETMVHLKPLRGIWAAYKPSRYYYEVVECIRRMALTGIAAFIPSNSIANVSIALLCAVVFVFVSEVLSPFTRGVDMGLYRWGNGIVVASMYVAFLMKCNVAKEQSSYLLTFSGVLIAANLFMVVAVVTQAVLLVKEFCRAKELVRQVDVPVRRTRSVPVRPCDSWNGQAIGEGADIDTESKLSDI